MSITDKIFLKHEIYIDDFTQPNDIIGKYAYNARHDEGGIILNVDSRGMTTDSGFYPTLTGDSVYDSVIINGFKVYEI